MIVNINMIILSLDKVADLIAKEEAPGNSKEEAVKFFRNSAYTLRSIFSNSKLWYGPSEVNGNDNVSSDGVSVCHLWDSVEEFFDEADWIDFGDIVKMNRSLDISPIFAVLIPTARNEDGTVISDEVRTFSTFQEAVMARDEAMKESDQ